MQPRARKVWLSAHVAISVGWFGGAYAMLVLAVAAATSDRHRQQTTYELMHIGDTMIMIPGSLGSLLTGLVLALYTRYRLLHFWWIVAKLVLTLAAMVFAYASVAANVRGALTAPDLAIDQLQHGVVTGSIIMLLALFVPTALSVVKPWGRTPLGVRTLARSA
jgi:hypothetical protein